MYGGARNGNLGCETPLVCEAHQPKDHVQPYRINHLRCPQVEIELGDVSSLVVLENLRDGPGMGLGVGAQNITLNLDAQCSPLGIERRGYHGFHDPALNSNTSEQPLFFNAEPITQIFNQSQAKMLAIQIG